MKKQSLLEIIGTSVLIFLLYICQSSEAFMGYPVQPWDQWVVNSESSFGDYRDWAPGYHSGIDLNLASGETDDLGEPVYAIADGEGFKIDDLGSNGWSIVIKHTSSGQPFTIPARDTPEYQYEEQSETEIFSVYIHIQPVDKLANEMTGPDGTTVTKGEVIGYIMDPGLGPHLHFEIRNSIADHSTYGSMLFPVENWAPNGTVENNGHYLDIQNLVVSGARHPLDFLDANVEALPSQAIYVDDDNTSEPWLGTQGDPYQYIQDGINAAVDGNTVLVLDGLYTGNGNKNLDFDGKAITVISQNGAEFTIIDCEGNGVGFYFHTGETASSIVNGFTIQQSNGDGILCISASPQITNNIIIDNQRCGIYASGNSQPIIKGNTISGNTSWLNAAQSIF